jgi:hypothetical protein
VVPRTTPSTHVPNGDVLVAQKKNNANRKKNNDLNLKSNEFCGEEKSMVDVKNKME